MSNHKGHKGHKELALRATEKGQEGAVRFTLSDHQPLRRGLPRTLCALCVLCGC